MLELAVKWSTAMHEAQLGLKLLAPECILVVVACAAFLLDLKLSKERSGPVLAWLALFGSFAALVLAWMTFTHKWPAEVDLPASAFWGSVAIDRFASFFKIVILFGTIFSIVLVHESRELRGRQQGEFYGLLFCAVAGACLMVSATEMVTAFLSIELVSIPSFALVAYIRRDRHGTEAALKYVLYSAFSTGCLLFGLSILFGLTGSTRFASIAFYAGTGPVSALTVGVASLLAFGGFAFKLAAAPFHFWAPDVYQGAPTPVTAWLSVASKAGAVGLFIRFVLGFMQFPVDPLHEGPSAGTLTLAGFDWQLALIVVSCITMTIGNLGAIFQTSMKRLLAYSSVAHVGYVLMGIASLAMIAPPRTHVPVSLSFGPLVADAGATAGAMTASGDVSGGAAAAFYIAAYLFMNLGAFACVIAVSNVTGTDDISSFRALGRRAPILAIALAMFVFALIGLPPTAGFTGKLQLFMAAIDQAKTRPAFWWLVGVAGVNSVVAVYYYLRIAKVMFLDGIMEPDAREPLPASPALTFVSAFLVLPVLGFGLAFNRILELTQSLELLRS